MLRELHSLPVGRKKLISPVDFLVRYDSRILNMTPEEIHNHPNKSKFNLWSIGEKTTKKFVTRLLQARTIYKKGPVGKAEEAGFEGPERAILEAIMKAKQNGAYTITSGGDSTEIAKRLTVPVEIGGGIRSMDVVEEYLGVGVGWVIVGTAAVDDRDFVLEAASRFPERIILGIDARDGLVKTKGWVEGAGISAVDLALSYRDAGIAAVIYTDISRDGVGGGVDIMATCKPTPPLTAVSSTGPR